MVVGWVVAIVVGWLVCLARWWLNDNGGFMGLGVMCVGLWVWVLCVWVYLWVWWVCLVVWRWHCDMVDVGLAVVL